MTTSPPDTIDIEKILNEFIVWEKNIVEYASIDINFNDNNELRNSISRNKYEKTLMDVRTYRLSLVLITTSKPYTLGRLAYRLGGYTTRQHNALQATLKRTLERMETYDLVSYEKSDCYKIEANRKLIDFFIKNKWHS
jgi:urease accessory protein UreE